MAAGDMGPVGGPSSVTIRCCDEAKNCVKDFQTDMRTLLGSMRYFKSYMGQMRSGSKIGQSVMISVHCDVEIFDLLLRFAVAQQQGQPCSELLTTGTVLPVLISSNFLGMEELVEECVQWISANLVAVAQQSADLSALPPDLLSRVARASSERALEDLHAFCVESGGSASGSSTPRSGANAVPGAPPSLQRLQQLSSRLYKHKLEGMLRELHTTVVRCIHCGAMYSLADKSKLACSVRKPNRGQSAALQGAGSTSSHLPSWQLPHEPDPSWRLQDHLAALRGAAAAPKAAGHLSGAANVKENGVAVASWRDIYWDVWGVVHVLYCHHCLAWFPAQELGMCPFHPEPPIFMANKASGRYPCCGGHAHRTAASEHGGSGAPGLGPQAGGGCCVREHTVLPASPAAPITSTIRLADGGGLAHGTAGALASPPAAETAAAAAAGSAVWQALQEWRHLIVPDTDLQGPPGPHPRPGNSSSSAWELISGLAGGEEEEEEEEEGGSRWSSASRSSQLRPWHSARQSQQSRPLQQPPPVPSMQPAGSAAGGRGPSGPRSSAVGSTGNGTGPGTGRLQPASSTGVSPYPGAELSRSSSATGASLQSRGPQAAGPAAGQLKATGQIEAVPAGLPSIHSHTQGRGESPAPVASLRSDEADDGRQKHPDQGHLLDAPHLIAAAPALQGNEGSESEGDMLTVLQALASAVASSSRPGAVVPSAVPAPSAGSGPNPMQQSSPRSSQAAGPLASSTSTAPALAGVRPVGAPVPVPRLPLATGGTGPLHSPRSRSAPPADTLLRSPRVAQTPAQAAAALLAATGVGTLSPGAGFQGPRGSSGNPVSRKLRLELLHEDDNIRMEALIMHLAACRPSRSVPMRPGPGSDTSYQPLRSSGAASMRAPRPGTSSSASARPSSVDRAGGMQQSPGLGARAASLGRAAAPERPMTSLASGSRASESCLAHGLAGPGPGGSGTTPHGPGHRLPQGRPSSAPRMRNVPMTMTIIGMPGNASAAAHRRPSPLHR